MLIKGIISFPTLFTAKVAKGATDPKFSLAILLPPTDPQVAAIKAEVDQAKLNSFPSGYTGQDECLQLYDTKYQGKDYYDPRFSGWYVFTCTAKEDDRPSVVDMNRQPVIDPAKVFSGMVAYVNAGISGYTKGKGGIGGWLNGVMITDEEPTMGRLDGKPSVEQMFANLETATAPAATTPPGGAPAAPAGELTMTPAANGMTYAQYKAAGWTDEQMIGAGVAQAAAPATPPAPPATPPAPPAPPAAPEPPEAGLVMTPAANGMTYEQYKASGWSDQQMINNGVAVAPSFA